MEQLTSVQPNAPASSRSSTFDAPTPSSALEDFPAFLRSGFQASPDPSILIDLVSGQVMRANPAAGALFRQDVTRMIGQTIDRLYPDQRGAMHVFTEEVLYRGSAYTRDLILYRANNEPLRLEHQGLAVRARDAVAMLVTIYDLDAASRRNADAAADDYHRMGIGEWRRAEHHFREVERENELILSAAGEGIYGVNADGITTFVNPAATKILGYDQNELVGQPMHQVIHHHHLDGSLYPEQDCPIYNAFREGEIKRVNDEIFWSKDGRPVEVEYTSTPIIDDGKYVGAVIVFRDISVRKRNELRLRQALDENAKLHRRLELENVYLQEEISARANHNEILGSSQAVTKILQQVDLVAPTNANVLITGESGTGKELVARAIHQASDRRDRPLICVNCAAIPRELFESEFFGHMKGAFTGALRDRVGRFELADGGTIFLDEVGEIPLDLQSKLLRVLQDKSFERVGHEMTRSVDVRVIVATNRDLQAEVAASRFREDLYFRLNVFPIECIPLRRRQSDIPILAEHFLRLACQTMNLPRIELTKGNVEMLMDYDWPGNVRELQNVIERAAILAHNGKVKIELGTNSSEMPEPGGYSPSDQAIMTETDFKGLMRENIKAALLACGNKVSGPDGAAAMLGIKPTTLASRIKALGVSLP